MDLSQNGEQLPLEVILQLMKSGGMPPQTMAPGPQQSQVMEGLGTDPSMPTPPTAPTPPVDPMGAIEDSPWNRVPRFYADGPEAAAATQAGPGRSTAMGLTGLDPMRPPKEMGLDADMPAPFGAPGAMRSPADANAKVVQELQAADRAMTPVTSPPPPPPGGDGPAALSGPRDPNTAALSAAEPGPGQMEAPPDMYREGLTPEEQALYDAATLEQSQGMEAAARIKFDRVEEMRQERIAAEAAKPPPLPDNMTFGPAPEDSALPGLTDEQLLPPLTVTGDPAADPDPDAGPGGTPATGGGSVKTNPMNNPEQAGLEKDARDAEEELNRIQQFAADKLGLDAAGREDLAYALMVGGATTMASGNPNFLGGIGEGALAGIHAYHESGDRREAEELRDYEMGRQQAADARAQEMHDLKVKQARKALAKAGKPVSPYAHLSPEMQLYYEAMDEVIEAGLDPRTEEGKAELDRIRGEKRDIF